MKLRLLFAILGSIFLLNCTTDVVENVSSLELIPPNSPVVLKINDLNTFKSDIEQNDILAKLHDTEGITTLVNRLKPLKLTDSQLGGYLAFIDNPKSTYDYVYIPTDTLPQIKLDSTTNFTVENIDKGTIKFDKYEVDGTVFYTSTFDKKQIIASSEVAINLIQKHLNDPTPLKETFLKFNTLRNSNNSSQIWLDLKNGEKLIAKILGTKNGTDVTNYADLSLDISLNDESMLLSGISIANDSLNNYMSLFSNTKPVSNTTISLAPEDTESFISYTFKDYKNFTKNQKSYLNITETRDSIFSAVEEIGIGHLENEKIIFLKTYGTANISDYLNNIQTNSLEYQGSEIIQLRSDSVLQSSFYPLIKDFTPNYATIMENAFAFSNSQETLESFINSNKAGKTLDKSLLYENIKNLTTEESTLLSLANTNGFDQSFSESGLEMLSTIMQNVKLSDYLFGSQIVADAGFFHTNYFIKKISAKENKIGTTEMFKTQLDSDIHLNPQFFTNHRTNRKDIVVQDQDNVLYLITNKGTIIWRKALESPIQGKIHEVDIYRNGKYQLAFTTNNRFYIIDRNGKEVAPFTFEYDGGNLNPLAVFDYSNNKNYRFVVTQEHKVYMYNNEGKIVTGFKYTTAEDAIIGAPQHFAIGTKDYLVFKLANGNLKILNRVGNVRVKVSEKIPFSENEIKVHQNKFITTSKDGILFEIDGQGNIQKSDLQLNADHGMDATSRTLVLMNDNMLSIRGKKVTLDLGVYSKPSIFYLNDKIYVSVTDIQNLKTYLFDSQAEPIDGFPVYGASMIDMADMDNDNKPELVLKDQENSIVTYKVN